MSISQYRIYAISGTPLERGRSYADSCKQDIRRMLEVEIHQAMIAKGLDIAEIYRYADLCMPHIIRDTPRTWDFIRGVSEMSHLSFQDVITILAHEEYCHGHATVHRCTGFAAGSSETVDGQTYIGQTWDWWSSMNPYKQIVHQTTETGLRILTYAFPGLWSGAGINSEGISLVWVSAGYEHFATEGRVRGGVPTYAIIAEILEQESFEAAIDVGMRALCAGWFIFQLASKDGRLGRIEVSPDAKAFVPSVSLAAAHCTYMGDIVAKTADRKSRVAHNARYAKMCELPMRGSGRLSREELLSSLRDAIPGNEDVTICFPLQDNSIGTLDAFLFSPSLGKAWFIPAPVADSEPVELTL